MATLTRNTPVSEPLVVSVQSSETAEAGVPATVTIPAGTNRVRFPIESVAAGVTDGNRTVTLTAAAPGFVSGSIPQVVSDSDLPDLVVSRLTFASNGIAGNVLAVSFRIENRRFVTVTNSFTQRIYVSEDPVSGGDLIAAQVTWPEPVAPGGFPDQTANIRLPSQPGTFWIVVQGDADLEVNELVEGNNTRLSDAPVVASASYTAVVTASPEVATEETSADGEVLFESLAEGDYVVTVTAEGHDSFRRSVHVSGAPNPSCETVAAARRRNVLPKDGGAPGITAIRAFLPCQTVRYTFTVVPTTVKDRYTLTVESVFETQVPIPVITVDPPSVDLSLFEGDEFQINFTVSNQGLIAAQNVEFQLPSTAEVQMTPLIRTVGRAGTPRFLQVVEPGIGRRPGPDRLPCLCQHRCHWNQNRRVPRHSDPRRPRRGGLQRRRHQSDSPHGGRPILDLGGRGQPGRGLRVGRVKPSGQHRGAHPRPSGRLSFDGPSLRDPASSQDRRRPR